MDKDKFDPDHCTYNLEQYDMSNIDMHGYPVYENVVKVQNDLQEEQLRDMHDDLKQAWTDYQILLEKYKFWDNVTK